MRGVQKLAYNVIKEVMFPDEQFHMLQQLCTERCALLFHPFDIFDGDGPNFVKAFALLEEISGPISIKVVKTWLNGWATSHRMHEEVVHGCLLGCRGECDSLKHYVMCPHMFAFLRYLFTGISEDPLIRFGIKSPEIFSLKVVSCLFSAYHALKGEVRAGKINLQTVNWLKPAWSVFAEAVKAEAGEMHLVTRAFSLAKFIDFLVTGGSHSPPGNLTAIQESAVFHASCLDDASQDTQ